MRLPNGPRHRAVYQARRGIGPLTLQLLHGEVSLMYVPASFAVDDSRRIHEAISAHSFGILVTSREGELAATHLPFLIVSAPGEPLVLAGHLARGNPQVDALDGLAALAIFSGPHAYISPTWYGPGPGVPTWNYVAVHVQGQIERITDAAELRHLVARTVDRYESAQPSPWTMPLDTPFAGRMLEGIVGFRLRADRVEGKWKLNQNKPAAARAGVIRELGRQADEQSRAVAALMQQTLVANERPASSEQRSQQQQ